MKRDGDVPVSLAAPSDRSLVTIALMAGIQRRPPPHPLAGRH
jgi:hypothetical protein